MISPCQQATNLSSEVSRGRGGAISGINGAFNVLKLML